ASRAESVFFPPYGRISQGPRLWRHLYLLARLCLNCQNPHISRERPKCAVIWKSDFRRYREGTLLPGRHISLPGVDIFACLPRVVDLAAVLEGSSARGRSPGCGWCFICT